MQGQFVTGEDTRESNRLLPLTLVLEDALVELIRGL